MTGTFRAASLLATPLAVAGLVGVLPLTASLAVAGAAMTVPGAFARLRSRDAEDR